MKRLVAVFESPEALVKGAVKLKAEGCPAEDALTPFHVEGVEDELNLKRPPVRRAMAIAGFGMAIVAWFLQWMSLSVAYPYISGDRPHNSWQIFPLVSFEVGVLAAGIAGFVTFLYTCGLPSLYHPAFDIPGVERASSDRFFLIANPLGDERLETRMRELLVDEGAVHIEEMPE
jgi:Protein of unknown function (DUF3341)